MLLIHDAFHFEASSGVGCDVCPFPSISRCKFKTSQKTNVVVEQPFWAQERHAFGHQFGVQVPFGTGKAEGTEQRAPTQEPPHANRKVKWPWCPVSCLSWLAVRVSFPGSGPWFSFPVPVCFLSVFSSSFCFFLLAAGVTSQLPDGRDVGSNARAPTQETVQGADPRTGFSRYSSTYDFLVYLVAPVLYFVFHFVILFSAYAFSDNANSVLSGARQVLQFSQDLFDPLEKYRLLWMEEDPLDCLLHAPRELSNRVTSYSWDAIRWHFSKRM